VSVFHHLASVVCRPCRTPSNLILHHRNKNPSYIFLAGRYTSHIQRGTVLKHSGKFATASIPKSSWRPWNFRSHNFNLINRNLWFSSFLVSSLSLKSWYEAQSVEYNVNWEIYTPYEWLDISWIGVDYTMDKGFNIHYIFWTPIHGILTLPMVYRTLYPWYFNPLHTAWWPPYPWYFDPLTMAYRPISWIGGS
jgi:hypothetical protein